MPTLEALKHLYNRAEYGRVSPGQQFNCSEETARILERNGVARRVAYETKVIVPEVQAISADTFRDVPDPDTEPPALAAVRAAVCAVSDAPEPRSSRSSERPRRKRSAAKR
jgi:hypothetical protein